MEKLIQYMDWIIRMLEKYDQPHEKRIREHFYYNAYGACTFAEWTIGKEVEEVWNKYEPRMSALVNRGE